MPINIDQNLQIKFMIGVVLCGGESKRMGSDKGLLKQADTSWVEIGVNHLSSLQIPVVISVNKTQVDLYSQNFSLQQLVIDDESLSVKGPLLGLLSVHQQLPEEDLLVIACDMVNLKKIVFQNLLGEHKKANFDAYVFTAGERVQPLCAVYTSRGLKRIHNICLANQLKKFSMMYVLECLDTKFISADAFADCFINYNSIEDLSVMNQSTE